MNLTYAIDIAATCEPADTTYLQTSSILTNYRPVCECCVYQAIEVSIHIYTYTVCFSHLIATATPCLTTPPRRVDGSGLGRGAGTFSHRFVSPGCCCVGDRPLVFSDIFCPCSAQHALLTVEVRSANLLRYNPALKFLRESQYSGIAHTGACALLSTTCS
jgi:hypothetical protein